MTYLFRASSIDALMTNPQSKADKDAGRLSKTAISALRKRAKEIVYGFTDSLDNKYLKKGIQCEDVSIALYNHVFGTSYKKNQERITSGLLTGECDLVAISNRRGVDIKTSWSLATFPALEDEVDSKNYEWQARAYMYLYDCDEWEIAYCLVSTPADLCMYEDQSLHYVDLIEPRMRVTTFTYKRDVEKEEEMLARVEQCNSELRKMVEALKRKGA